MGGIGYLDLPEVKTKAAGQIRPLFQSDDWIVDLDVKATDLSLLFKLCHIMKAAYLQLILEWVYSL